MIYVPLRSIDGQLRVDNTHVQKRGPAEKVAIWPVKSHSFYIMHLSIKTRKHRLLPRFENTKTGKKRVKNDLKTPLFGVQNDPKLGHFGPSLWPCLYHLFN